MKNKKGFTLIELLAVIVILGLLMAIAIPSVTKYITQSRKKTLVNSMDSYITAATTAVNNNEYGALSDQDVIYYIPVSNDTTKSCVSLEKGGTDPFGNWKEAYVAVNYNAEKYSYDYFFTFYDDAGYGMSLTKSDAIKPSGDGQIINPTPVNADSITTQLGGRAKSSKVLSVGTCNSSNTTNNTEIKSTYLYSSCYDGDINYAQGMTWNEWFKSSHNNKFIVTYKEDGTISKVAVEEMNGCTCNITFRYLENKDTSEQIDLNSTINKEINYQIRGVGPTGHACPQ